MDGVLMTSAKRPILDLMMLGAPFAAGNCTLLLFDTLSSIADSANMSGFSGHELTFAGYARQVVNFSTPSILVGTDKARAVADMVTFTSTDAAPSSTVTGWALIDEANNLPIIAGLYDTPFVIAPGGTYDATPFFDYTGELTSEP